MSPSLPLGISTRASDWPAITPDEAQDILSGFSIPPARTILWRSNRPFTAAALIGLEDNSKVFLKRHDHRLRTETTLLQEHHFGAHLAAHGIPVMQPLHTAKGKSAINGPNGVYEAFPSLIGQDLYRDTPSWHAWHSTRHAHAAGQMLARFHQASASYDAPERTNCPLVSGCRLLLAPDITTLLQERTRQDPFLTKALPQPGWENEVVATLSPFLAQLHPFLPHIRPCWGHGDWHGSNLSWTAMGISHVFDLGMSNRTCIPFDIAVAIERSIIRWLEPHHPRPVHYAHLNAFLSGYTMHHPLSASDRALVSGFLPLAHVEFALSEISYYHHLLDDPESAMISYRGYLLGHADWFATPTGQRLLHWIAEWETPL